MPSSLRDPKTLPDWIELDYYRRSRRMRRVRRLAIWLALLISAGVVAATIWPRGRVAYEPGPLSPAHQSFHEDCQTCHTEMLGPARRIVPTSAPVPSVADDVCRRCHEGPLHNDRQAQVPGCAACHKEHRGQPLAAVSDGHCTDCHADIHRAIAPGHEPRVADVTSFRPGAHPEFALWKPGNADPGALHFNHQVHLKLNDANLRGADGKPVRLECASCHQPDSERRYMLPVSYDRDCKSCHPLGVQVTGDWKAGPVARAADEFRKTPAPHREPEMVRAVLRERYVDFARRNPGVLGERDTAEPERVLPGQAARPADAAETEAAWVREQLKQAEHVLFDGAGGCRYCHVSTGTRGPTGLPGYAVTNLPKRWLTHARFGHNSHRLLACTECHDAPKSTDTRDILMPKVDVCFRCHNTQVGARSNCIECHQYHDHSKDTAVSGDRTIDDWLRTK